jgi:hypothetical protein
MQLKFEITKAEFISAPRVIQPTLSILKAKGAPVKGTFWLKADLEKYSVWSHEEPGTGTMVYQFVEKVNQDSEGE